MAVSVATSECIDFQRFDRNRRKEFHFALFSHRTRSFAHDRIGRRRTEWTTKVPFFFVIHRDFVISALSRNAYLAMGLKQVTCAVSFLNNDCQQVRFRVLQVFLKENLGSWECLSVVHSCLSEHGLEIEWFRIPFKSWGFIFVCFKRWMCFPKGRL